VGVAEDLLAPADALVAVDDVLALGQPAEVDDPRVQPVLVRMLGGQVALISSSSTMRPCAVSTSSMRPGWSRPFLPTRDWSTSITPTSEAMMTRSSSVTQ
jgi:hypothetical protein